MNKTIQTLKSEIKKLVENTDFKHHFWYTDYHLNIVEKISLELTHIYTEADVDLIQMIVWMHDYGKIVNQRNEHEETLISGKRFLLQLGFSEEIAEKCISYIKIFDNKQNLDAENIPIEIKIVSSADGAAHMIGPFYSIYFYENPEKDIEEILAGNRKKLDQDWNKKMVLPEVKEKFAFRYAYLQECFGKFPRNYF